MRRVSSGMTIQALRQIAKNLGEFFAKLRRQMPLAVQSVALGQAVTVKRARIESIDVVRGLIMILMALDHTRDFFGNSGLNPTDPATTTIPLFFTRWITHFCAPAFFLLTGTGAWLAGRRKPTRELSRFLFTRGVWLIFLEFVVSRGLGWQFNFDYHVTVLIVLWALGVAMIATHNLFDSIQPSNPLWMILHAPGIILATPRHTVFVGYALIPWIGV